MSAAPVPASRHIAWAELGLTLDSPWTMPTGSENDR